MADRKTRVLYITYYAANEPLLDSRTIPVIREFLKDNFEFHLITFEKKLPPAKGAHLYDKKYLQERFKGMGIKWHPLKYHKWPLVISTAYDVCVGVLYGVYIAARMKADLIHAQTSAGGAMGIGVAKILKKKLVYDVSGLLAEEYVDGGIWKRGSLVFKVVSYLEKRIIFHSDGIIPLSKKGANIMTEGSYISYRKTDWKFQIIPSHVDMKRFRLSTSKNTELQRRYNLTGRFVLIYLGSVGTWYMLDEMLDFFIAAKKVIREAVFFIINHTDREIIKLKAAMRNIGGEDLIITVARPDQIPEYLSLGDAAIFFIKPTFSKQACSPVKLGEYLASGLPVVINSNVADTEDLIRSTKTGVVVDEFSERAYENAALELRDLIDTDKDIRYRCSRAAAEQLSLEVAMEAYRRLYKDVIYAANEK